MTLTIDAGTTRSRAAAVVLGRGEARRLLAHPLVAAGLALSGVLGWLAFHFPSDWSGARYTVAPVLLGPTLIAISVAVAGAFHREQAAFLVDLPIGEQTRSAGRLLGALPLALLVGAIATIGAAAIRALGGLDLGDAPGRTLHAQFSAAEVLQQPCLALLAIAAGAAAGRRLPSFGNATLLLVAAWFPVVFVVWGFQDRHIIPFAIIQQQPVLVPIAHQLAEPARYPPEWLLSAPGEFQDGWMRLVRSESLAAWHDVYLVGLAVALIGLAWPLPRRAGLMLAGAAIATLGVSMQYLALR